MRPRDLGVLYRDDAHGAVAPPSTDLSVAGTGMGRGGEKEWEWPISTLPRTPGGAGDRGGRAEGEGSWQDGLVIKSSQAAEPEGSLDARLERWVESSGRALELRVARAFWQRDWRVSTSFPYVDLFAPNATREGDVLGDLEWTGSSDARCLLRVIVECKHTPGKPWVSFFGDPPPPASFGQLSDLVVFAHGSHVGLVEPAVTWAGLAPFTNSPASHVVTALGNDSQNPANDAVRQALSAAYAIKGQYLASQSSVVSEGPRGWIIFAVVVTTSPLYQCHLSSNGRVEVQPVDEVDVWGHAADGSRSRVFIRNENSLGPFLDQLRERVVDTTWA